MTATTGLLVFIAIGLAVYSLAYWFMKKKNIARFTSTHFGAIAAGAFLVGFIPVMIFGVFRGWIYSTGYPEVNHASIKAQKAPYPLTINETVVSKGLEPDASTRMKAQALKNPVAATSESLALGKDLFKNYCQPCHGADGYGQGVMGSVPMLRLKPTSTNEAAELSDYLDNFTGSPVRFTLDYVQKNTEGDIYYSITNGGEAIMPSFRDALSPEQRWSLINYIKKELGRNDG